MKQTIFTSFVLFLMLQGAVIAQEVQVPFDSAGTIMSIDKGLEHSLQLFPNLEYFEEAHLFKNTDSTYSVEIMQDSSHVIMRSHLLWTARDRDSAQMHITNYIAREHPEFYLDQKGRANLMLGVTLLSIFAWGPSLPVMLDMHDAGQITGAYLLFGGGAYLLASNLTSRMEVTAGEASFANTGGVLGLAHGSLLALTFGGEHTDFKTITALSTLTSIGEFIANYNIAKNVNMTTGTASVLSTGSVFGGLYGLAIPFIVSDQPSVQTVSALALCGSISGYFLGDMLARNHSYSDGDVTALSLAATFGGLIPLANLAAGDVTNHTALAGLSLAGSVAAAAIVHEATRNTGFSTGQGLILSLGTVAGMLTGTGLGLIAKSDFQTGVFLASLGTIAGYAITFKTLQNSQTASSNVHSGDKGSLDVQVNPVGILTAFRGSQTTNELAAVKYHF